MANRTIATILAKCFEDSTGVPGPLCALFFSVGWSAAGRKVAELREPLEDSAADTMEHEVQALCDKYLTKEADRVHAN